MKIDTFLFHDPSEARSDSRCPKELFEQSRPIPKLEEMTGADFILSTLSKPPRTEAIIREHSEAGALFVQRKSGNDLLSSVDDRRIFQATVKMMSTGARMSQRILLTTGIFAPAYDALETDSDEPATSVGQIFVEPGTWPSIAWVTNHHLKWEHFITAMSKSVDRGLRWEQLLTDEEIVSWFAMKRRHLIEYADKSIRHLFPTPEFPEQIDTRAEALQIPVVVDDWRLALSCVPGFGPAKIQAIAEYAPTAYVWPMLSDLSNVGRALPKGIGKKAVDTFRDFFEIPDEMSYILAPIVPFGSGWTHCGIHNILHTSGDDCPMCNQDKNSNWVDPLAEKLNESRADKKAIPGDGAEFVDADDDPPWDTEETETETNE